jgi:ankyrin repeat protein
MGIRKGKVEVVKLLLEAGADPNWQVPDTGNTPLHDALKQLKLKMSKMMMEIVRLLLLKGADSTIRNKQQKTAHDYAEKFLP